MRATICVAVDFPDEVREVEAWFAAWRENLTYVSDNQGCGCCVDIWDVDGPREAIDVIPEHSQSASDWATPRS